VDVVARSAPNTNGHAALLSNLTSLYINQVLKDPLNLIFSKRHYNNINQFKLSL